MCEPEELPPLSLSTYDKTTGKLLEERLPFCIAPKKCYDMTCDRCKSWNQVFGDCPLQTVSTAKDGNVQEVTTLHGCSVEFSDDNTWRKIPNHIPNTTAESDPDYSPGKQKESFTTLWFPIVGTRAEFMLSFYNSYVQYRNHMW